VLAAAPRGRARCRGCGRPIEKASVRFGERLPNAFGEGEMTLWFHPPCAAYRRPEPLLEALAAGDGATERRDWLEAEARRSLAHRRLPRAGAAGRAPTGRARCRSCREPIPKGAWRISLAVFEEGMFHDAGFVHAGCSAAYLGTSDVLDRLLWFSPDLTAADADELATALSP
jgi:hypothetical protein